MFWTMFQSNINNFFAYFHLKREKKSFLNYSRSCFFIVISGGYVAFFGFVFKLTGATIPFLAGLKTFLNLIKMKIMTKSIT